MSPFTERPGFKTDDDHVTALGAELMRVGLADPHSNALHDATVKIIRESGHNFDLMATKLYRALSRKHDLQHALCLLYVKACYREIHPGQVLVGTHIRGGQSHGPATSAPSEVQEGPIKRGPGRPKAAPPKPGKDTRDPSRAIEAQKIYLTSDGKDWATISYPELVARARDGHVAQALLDYIGSQPPGVTKNVGELVPPNVLASICGA